MKVSHVPWRDSRRIVYFVKSKPRGIDTLTYAQAVLVAADPTDKRSVLIAYTDPVGQVHVAKGGAAFNRLAKRAVRAAQEREDRPQCQARTKSGSQCSHTATRMWRDINVCDLHDPLGKFAKGNPEFAAKVLAMLRESKKTEVDRLENRLTALLLERYGPSKGKGVIG